MLTKTDRVTADGDVRTASATMAWFFRSRPTDRTVIGAETRAVGFRASAASVATRIWASPERAASFDASSRASPRSPRVWVTGIDSIACRTRARSPDSLTTMRDVRSAAIRLTFPPCQAGRSLEEGPGREERERHDEQQLQEEQEAPAEALPGRVRLDVRDESRPEQRRRHDRLVAAQLEEVHRDHGRHEQQAEQRERRRERHRSSPGPAGGGARRTSGRPG
jgi:hypothetical protein